MVLINSLAKTTNCSIIFNRTDDTDPKNTFVLLHIQVCFLVCMAKWLLVKQHIMTHLTFMVTKLSMTAGLMVVLAKSGKSTQFVTILKIATFVLNYLKTKHMEVC